MSLRGKAPRSVPSPCFLSRRPSNCNIGHVAAALFVDALVAVDVAVVAVAVAPAWRPCCTWLAVSVSGTSCPSRARAVDSFD